LGELLPRIDEFCESFTGETNGVSLESRQSGASGNACGMPLLLAEAALQGYKHGVLGIKLELFDLIIQLDFQ